MAENLGSIYSEIRLKIDKLRSDVADARAQLATAQGLLDKMAADTSSRLADRMQNVGETMAGVGAAMTGVGIGIAGALGAAVKTTASFDKEMSKVRALSGATEAEFQILRKAAIDLGAQSVFSASQAAEGMSILAAAGFNTQQVLDAMPGVLNAAAAAGEDFATVSDIMVAAMSGFGLQAKDMTHIADVLASSANASAISITDLGYTFKYVAPVAQSAGQSLETMAAAAAILGNAGIKADQAGTTLRMALIRLADPPKEAARWLEELGIKTTDASGKMLPLSNIIGQLNTKFRGLSQEQQLAAASSIFGAEAMSGMLTLIKAGPSELDKLAQSFVNSSGAAKKMADDMNNNLAGAWEQFMGAVESLAINIGDKLAPALVVITNFLQKLVQGFNSLPPSIQTVIAVMAVLAAGIALVGGPLLILLGMLPTLVAGWAAFSAAMAGLAPILLPIVSVLAAIAAGAYLLYQAWTNNFGGIRDATLALWAQIQAKFQEAYNVIAPLISGLVAYILQRWQAIQPVLQPVLNWLSAAFSFVFKFVADTVMFYINAVVNVISGAVKIITGIIKFFVALFTGDWKGMWEAVKQIVSGAVQALWGLLNLWFVGRIAGLIGGFINKTIGAFSGFISKTIGMFTSWVARKFALIGQWASGMVSRSYNAMNGMLQAIVQGIGWMLSRFGSFIQNIFSAFASIPGRMAQIGGNIVRGLWDGISSLAGWLKSRITNWAAAVLPGPIADLLGIRSPSRLMMDYGNNIAEGLARGILNAKEMVRSASEQLAGMTLAAAPSPALATSAGSMLTESNRSMQQNVQQNAPLLYIDNLTIRNDEDLQSIQDTVRQIYEENSKVLRAMGRRK